jgi:iron(II)-dependent oxidoreductase
MTTNPPAPAKGQPWITLRSGEQLPFPDGFIPRLVAFTHEDKAAKGLRSLKERGAEAERPFHFSALEIIQENRCTLLTAPAGGGKTGFAIHLALNLAGEIEGDPTLNHRRLAVRLPRNDLGDWQEDGWRTGLTVPAYVAAEKGQPFAAFLDAAIGGGRLAESFSNAILIIDNVDRIGADWSAFSEGIGEALLAYPGLHILLLGDAAIVDSWTMPAGITRHPLLPLLASQRRQFETDILAPRRLALGPAALEEAAAHPSSFALAQRLDGDHASAEAIIDAWYAVATSYERQAASGNRFLRQHLAARTLGTQSPSAAAALFRDDPIGARPVLASLLNRLAGEPQRLGDLIDRVIGTPGDAGLRGALLAAEAIDRAGDRAPAIIAVLTTLIDDGHLTARERAQAGVALALHGDPRDLEALADVPGGAFVMGSATHPNSLPVHDVRVAAFRIGNYPVVNANYRRFIEATGRAWPSKDGRLATRANAPAVDLTWHDANAYCRWLTERWRDEGRIAAREVIRLPTEAEWERAARGDQPDGYDRIVYPWAGVWRDCAANAEPAGFNDTTSVGLFPQGKSPYGCHDMAGQVWEWCSTLWGEAMATPSFAYPYRPDGRENQQAPDSVRRVLRGGCFSSGSQKACATYRGSLEANGFWRGNGFRIVVAPLRPD